MRNPFTADWLRKRASAFKYETLRAGSMSDGKKKMFYNYFYNKLKRQANKFNKSEFKDLELQSGMADTLKPLSKLNDDELDSQLALMFHMDQEKYLNVRELRNARDEFYSDYERDLSDVFYKDPDDKTIDNDVYVRFVNFVQVAHHSHIEEMYDSDIITSFKNSLGVEDLDFYSDSDELYTEFFEYAEAHGLSLREKAGF